MSPVRALFVGCDVHAERVGLHALEGHRLEPQVSGPGSGIVSEPPVASDTSIGPVNVSRARILTS
ncbi:MAG: hypothetical protein AAF851_21440 [Myxococcota bacterium]